MLDEDEHNWLKIEQIDATCQTPGRAGGYICLTCPEDDEIMAKPQIQVTPVEETSVEETPIEEIQEEVLEEELGEDVVTIEPMEAPESEGTIEQNEE